MKHRMPAHELRQVPLVPPRAGWQKVPPGFSRAERGSWTGVLMMFAAAMAGLFLVDPRLMSRVIVSNVLAANICVFAVWAVFFVYTLYLRPPSPLNLCETLLISALLFSCLRAWAASIKVSNIVQLFGGYACAFGVINGLRGGLRPRQLITLFVLALAIHSIIVWEPWGLIRDRAFAQTAYDDDFAINELIVAYRRAIGAWSAPGYLVCFSSICLGLFATLAVVEKKLLWGAGAVVAMCLGLATGNRSFPIILAALPAVLGVVIGARRLLPLFILLGICLPVVAVVSTSAEYSKYIASRFEVDVVDRDVKERLRGHAGVLPALAIATSDLHNFTLGAYMVDPLTGGARVGDSASTVEPHFGLVSIFASRGIFAALAYITLCGLAFVGYIRAIRRQSPQRSTIQAFLAALILGQIVAISEPLAEFGPLMICIAVGLFLFTAVRPDPHGIPRRA